MKVKNILTVTGSAICKFLAHKGAKAAQENPVAGRW